MSSTVVSIWRRTNAASTGWIPATPRVLCAVSAVIALVPKTPRAWKVLRSAWIPAPPEESLPAIVSATGGVRDGVKARWAESAPHAPLHVLELAVPQDEVRLRRQLPDLDAHALDPILGEGMAREEGLDGAGTRLPARDQLLEHRHHADRVVARVVHVEDAEAIGLV